MKEIPQKTYYTIWYQDLENTIREVYGQPFYSIVDHLDGRFVNGMYDTWNTVDGEEWIIDREDDLRDWVAGNEDVDEPDPRALLWHLAETGEIPHGDYLIHIWW